MSKEKQKENKNKKNKETKVVKSKVSNLDKKPSLEGKNMFIMLSSK